MGDSATQENRELGRQDVVRGQLSRVVSKESRFDPCHLAAACHLSLMLGDLPLELLIALLNAVCDARTGQNDVGPSSDPSWVTTKVERMDQSVRKWRCCWSSCSMQPNASILDVV